MKNLITIMILLVAVGCGKSDTERLEAENKRLEAELKKEEHKLDTAAKNKKLKKDLLKLSVVGSYEANWKGKLNKLVFQKNGTFEDSYDGDKVSGSDSWAIVRKEIHVRNMNSQTD